MEERKIEDKPIYCNSWYNREKSKLVPNTDRYNEVGLNPLINGKFIFKNDKKDRNKNKKKDNSK